MNPRMTTTRWVKQVHSCGTAMPPIVPSRRSRSDAPYGYYSREPTGRPVSSIKAAHRGLKIYAVLTWDRGFELLHRAQRHTNPIDPRPRLHASAYLGRARRHANQLSWNWIRAVHALRWCRGDSSITPNQPPRHGGHDDPKHRNRACRSHRGSSAKSRPRSGLL